MLWLTLSILTALAVSSQDFWVKKSFSHLSAYEMATYPLVYSFPLFSIAAFFAPVPPLDSTFLWCFLISLPLNVICMLLYMKAIKVSPLSLTVPFLAFTPVFIIGTGSLFLNEMPNSWGIIGIVVICLGGYTLNIEPGRWSFLAPLKAFSKEKGSWLMFIVAFLFSFAAVIGKKAMLHSSPLFFAMTFFASLNLFQLVVFISLRKVRLKTFTKYPLEGSIAGCLFFAQVVFHSFAIILTKAAYMISIKRISIIFSMIYGWLFFKEHNIKMRFFGALLMFMGAVIISVKG